VAEWIEETRGFETIVRMLRAYGDGRGSDEIFRSSLGADPETLDRAFDQWLTTRHPTEHVAAYFDHLRAGSAHLAAGRLVDSQRSLESAAELFPVSRGASPYALLARLHLQDGRKREAADALTKLVATSETAYAENLQLAELLEELGDPAGAAAALERTIFMFPYEISLHSKLADLYDQLGEPGGAVRARRAVVALRPVDLAQARYRLARSLLASGDRAGARSEVLRALEIAPAFESAQELLLELRDAAGGTR
jgi:tetratricopeptide (TPR) repeat protein